MASRTGIASDSSDELPDPRQPTQQPDVARLSTEGDLVGAIDWWTKRFAQCVDAGIADFRCVRPQYVPAEFWSRLIVAVRQHHPHASFMASTLGIEAAASEGLAECGFDLVASCSRNWDYRAEDFPETIDHLAHIAPVIAMPEAPFDRRLSSEFRDTGRAQRAARRALAFAMSYGAGWMMPMGFEFGAARDMDAARDRPEDFERLDGGAPFDLSAEIATANSRCASGTENAAASVRSLSPPEVPAAALLITERSNGR